MDHEHKPTSPGESSEDEETSRPIPTSPGGPTHSGAARERSFPTSPGEPTSDREPSRPVPTSPGSPHPDQSPHDTESARHRQVEEQEQRIAQERLNHKETPR